MAYWRSTTLMLMAPSASSTTKVIRSSSAPQSVRSLEPLTSSKTSPMMSSKECFSHLMRVWTSLLIHQWTPRMLEDPGGSSLQPHKEHQIKKIGVSKLIYISSMDTFSNLKYALDRLPVALFLGDTWVSNP